MFKIGALPWIEGSVTLQSIISFIRTKHKKLCYNHFSFDIVFYVCGCGLLFRLYEAARKFLKFNLIVTKVSGKIAIKDLCPGLESIGVTIIL